MIIKHVSKQNSILNKFIAEIRDKRIQKDSLRFRTNIERMGEIISYELSKTLQYRTQNIETPLGIKKMNVLDDKIVLDFIRKTKCIITEEHQNLANLWKNMDYLLQISLKK